MIMQRKDGGAIKKKAIELGMVTFRDHGIDKVLKGITTVEEVLGVTTDKDTPRNHAATESDESSETTPEDTAAGSRT
jgi:hypothetical protein